MRVKKDTMNVRLFCIDGTNLVRTAYGYGGPAHQAQEQADSERLVDIFAQVCEEAGGAFERDAPAASRRPDGSRSAAR